MDEKEIRRQIAYHLREIKRLNRILYPNPVNSRPPILCGYCGKPMKDQIGAHYRQSFDSNHEFLHRECRNKKHHTGKYRVEGERHEWGSGELIVNNNE